MTQTFGALPDANEIRSDERLIALFAHLSLFFGGILLPIIFWITNKEKSKFVVFHSLQALWFHIAYVVVLIAFIIVFVFVMVIGGIGLAGMTQMSGNQSMPAFMIIIMIAFYALLFLGMFAGIGYSIFMGIKAYQGKLVKYPIIGSKVYKHVYGTGV